MKNFIIKGDIIYSDLQRNLIFQENGFLVCLEGKVAGVFKIVPEIYSSLEVIDYSGKLIVPGFCDLHLHASQYQFRGTGMDMQLLDWLNSHAFPEEVKYSEAEYAQKSYQMFTDEMRKGFTTRASVFATLHKDSTLILADLLDKSGLKGYVGLVNMNRNSPVYLCQSDFDKAVSDTEEFIVRCNKLSGIKPIITPRFIPSVDKPLLHQLHLLRDKYQLKCQSHLDENLKEIDWVKALEPDCESYSQCYEREDLLRNSVMAHCVYLKADERKLLKERKTFIAHCPDSNLNVCSGIAPIREYLDDDMLVGIGTDVAGGCSSSMIHSMALAIQVSKVNTMLQNKNDLPLNISDVFAMATILGGQFFGKVGSFLPGYEFDCLVIDDSKVPYLGTLSLSERLERFVYLGNESAIVDKFVSGKAIDLK